MRSAASPSARARPRCCACLDFAVPMLPADRPRYLMGVGKPDDIVGAVERGIDMFDCVLPTRSGRTGQAFTRDGPINIKNARFAEDVAPLDPECLCPVCATWSRAYVHHLVRSGEISGRDADDRAQPQFLPAADGGSARGDRGRAAGGLRRRIQGAVPEPEERNSALATPRGPSCRSRGRGSWEPGRSIRRRRRARAPRRRAATGACALPCCAPASACAPRPSRALPARPSAGAGRLGLHGAGRSAFSARGSRGSRGPSRLARLALLARLRFLGGRFGAGADQGDLRPDQLLDIVDRLGVLGRPTRVMAMPVSAGAAGAADAMDIIVRMPGNVVIEDVADALDVEAAGGDVGGDQDVDLVLLEAVELARCALAWSMSPWISAGGEAVPASGSCRARAPSSCGCRRSIALRDLVAAQQLGPARRASCANRPSPCAGRC